MASILTRILSDISDAAATKIEPTMAINSFDGAGIIPDLDGGRAICSGGDGLFVGCRVGLGVGLPVGSAVIGICCCGSSVMLASKVQSSSSCSSVGLSVTARGVGLIVNTSTGASVTGLFVTTSAVGSLLGRGVGDVDGGGVTGDFDGGGVAGLHEVKAIQFMPSVASKLTL